MWQRLLRTGLWLVFLMGGFWSAADAQNPPTARDFKQSIQDLQDIDGELVWLQGALKRGDPSPYMNPEIPMAAYEQGLLDEKGELWIFLDTPEGRELRYNQELRGKMVKIQGWLYPQTKIIEVYKWKDMKGRPVRTREDFKVPERPPFDPNKAASIETIPPIKPSVFVPDTQRKDLWFLMEGTDLSGTSKDQIKPATTVVDPRLRKILDETPEQIPKPATQTLQVPSTRGSSSQPVRVDRGLRETLPRPGMLEPKVRNEKGEALTNTQEFDQAIQSELIEQIKP